MCSVGDDNAIGLLERGGIILLATLYNPYSHCASLKSVVQHHD